MYNLESLPAELIMMDSELLSRTKEHRDHVTWDVRPTETLLISCVQIFPPVRILLVLIVVAYIC